MLVIASLDLIAAAGAALGGVGAAVGGIAAWRAASSSLAAARDAREALALGMLPTVQVTPRHLLADDRRPDRPLAMPEATERRLSYGVAERLRNLGPDIVRMRIYVPTGGRAVVCDGANGRPVRAESPGERIR